MELMVLAMVFLAIVEKLMDHGIDHPGEEWDQPNKPDKNAELVKFLDPFFLFGQQHNGRPNGVAQHQNDRQCAGDTVYVKIHFTGQGTHKGCTCCIKNEADPKKQQVPGFESAGNLFTPNADRVENQR
jgi:hypothetical protein